jgi:hypothetical protein
MKLTDLFKKSDSKKALDILLKTKIKSTFEQNRDLWNKLNAYIKDKKNPIDYRIKAQAKIAEIHELK